MSPARGHKANNSYPSRYTRKLQNKTRPQWRMNLTNTSSSSDALAEEITNPTLPTDLHLAIATIKASLGLSVTDLSTCLDITRQTIYTWIRNESKPQQPHIKQRLDDLYKVAKEWQLRSQLPAKEFCTKITELLKPDFKVDEAISALENALQTPNTQKRQKSNFEKLLDKNGIEISSLPSQDEQFDLITGKSNFFGDFDEPED